jgi:hypothetical protein
MEFYNRNLNSLTAHFSDIAQKNEQIISEKLKTQIQSVQRLIDVQHRIASCFAWLWFDRVAPLRRGRHELMPLLLSAFHKNFFSFYAAIKLTSYGLHGPACPIIRIIFKFLMTAKFCHICADFRALERWTSRETVYFANMVLKKIVSPDPQPFFDFWTMICELSHATTSSLQISLDMDDNENLKNTTENVALLNALLECNYHLLNSHLITPQLEYTEKFYLNGSKSGKQKYEVPELRKAAHSIFQSNRKFLGSKSIGLISAYKKTWLVQSQKAPSHNGKDTSH